MGSGSIYPDVCVLVGRTSSYGYVCVEECRASFDSSRSFTILSICVNSMKAIAPATANGIQTNIDGDGPGPQSGQVLAKSMKKNPIQITIAIETI